MFRLTVVTVLTLLMFGCAGTPDWVTKGPMNDPEWISKGSDAFKEIANGVEALYAVGSVQGISITSLAWEVAEGRARAQLARIFKTQSRYALNEDTSIDFARQQVCTKDEDGNPEKGTCVPAKAIHQDMTREVNTLTDMVVSGARQVDRFYEKKTGIYYVLVKLPFKYISERVLVNEKAEVTNESQ